MASVSFGSPASSPGPSTITKPKKRMMTLVNPANPDDFSTDSISPDSRIEAERRSREVTPTSSGTVTASSFLTVGESGVKGILRSAGTPGSGNGVRFFPKNRFRVITPREEIGGPSTPQKPIAPPQPQSFFSHLLSVVPAAMSPRRAPPISTIPTEPDESWERPGEEGEISLVASSVMSAERSTVLEDEDDGEGVSLEVPWTGPAEVHSSPLFVPLEGNSRDISIQDLQAPEISMDRWKMRMQGQEDVSNLLSTSLPGYGETSFSIGSMAGPSFFPPPLPKSDNARQEAVGGDVSGVSWMKGDQSSMTSMLNEEDNPTIRRQLSPIPSPQPAESFSITESKTTEIISPLPTRSTKAYTSIFADMSAEQAELSWPLTRPASASSSKLAGPSFQADETTFHSFLPSSPISSSPMAISTSPKSEPPLHLSSSVRPGPSSATPGNDTEFFDAPSFFSGTPCPTKPALSAGLTAGPLTSLRPSVYSGSLGRNSHLSLGLLAHPTKNLFEAQRSHTAAITSELDMYRQLAHKLGKEVEERDKVLAEMNIRMIENEMRSAEAQSQAKSTVALSGKRKSLSPSPVSSPLAFKSTGREAQKARMEVEGEIRELEIRLQKALSDSRELRDEMEAKSQAEFGWNDEKRVLQDSIKEMEDREKDSLVERSRQESQLAEARRDAETSRSELESIKMEMEGLREMREVDRQDIDRLGEVLEKAREGRKREESFRDALERLQRETEELKRDRLEIERELEGERRANTDMEIMIKELKIALYQSQSSLAEFSSAAQRDHTAYTTLEKEAARLRTESSDKDMELLNLQRRKNELKEDREMLNVALDSKQQEVELLKRKLARFSQATPIPLGTSQRQNLDKRHPQSAGKVVETPMPATSHFKLQLHPTTALPTATGRSRRSSAAYATPLQANGRTMRSGAVLMEDQRTSTVVKDRVMRRMPAVPVGEIAENIPPARRPIGRERVLA